MRFLGMLVSVIIFSNPVLADMTPEERCEERGELAHKASKLRIQGIDKDTAIGSLTEEYDRPDTSITALNVRGLVTVSYMAKMKPEQMRNYAISECKKDILK
ncbi:MAG: hypothetical protein DRQ62_07675 [Gammaproteobacteria bacterium]|nr:MAG: hypothetical protein DRQ62_07675 [Gammaproteobacteria bacterium]